MIKNLFINTIKFYKKRISPILKSSCVFTPTCSTYAIEAYQKHNVFYASILVVYRILRCNSLNKGGFDPVPDSFSKIKWVI